MSDSRLVLMRCPDCGASVICEDCAALTALLGEKEIHIDDLQRDYDSASGRIVALTDRIKELEAK